MLRITHPRMSSDYVVTRRSSATLKYSELTPRLFGLYQKKKEISQSTHTSNSSKLIKLNLLIMTTRPHLWPIFCVALILKQNESRVLDILHYPDVELFYWVSRPNDIHDDIFQYVWNCSPLPIREPKCVLNTRHPIKLQMYFFLLLSSSEDKVEQVHLG